MSLNSIYRLPDGELSQKQCNCMSVDQCVLGLQGPCKEYTYDGLTAFECLEKYEYMQRDIEVAITPLQLHIARLMWSHELHGSDLIRRWKEMHRRS